MEKTYELHLKLTEEQRTLVYQALLTASDHFAHALHTDHWKQTRGAALDAFIKEIEHQLYPTE